MTGYTLPAYAKLLIAAGFGAAFWVGTKLLDADKSLSSHQRDTAKVLTFGFIGVLLLLQIGMGGL